jgi:hypothetical protein
MLTKVVSSGARSLQEVRWLHSLEDKAVPTSAIVAYANLSDVDVLPVLKVRPPRIPRCYGATDLV